MTNRHRPHDRQASRSPSTPPPKPRRFRDARPSTTATALSCWATGLSFGATLTRLFSGKGWCVVRVDLMARGLKSRAVWLAIVAASFIVTPGCGNGSSTTVSSHPDTGVGAGETPPAMINCLDFCLRGADCLGQLCNEDKMSTAYTALGDAIASQCSAECATAGSLAGVTPAEWQCLFQSSCRQVFERDVCGVQAHYSCQ